MAAVLDLTVTLPVNPTLRYDRLSTRPAVFQCRGFVVNGDLEREIWGRAFRSVLRVDPAQSSLLLTEAPFALPAVADLTAQVGQLLQLPCRSDLCLTAALRFHWKLSSALDAPRS